MFRDKGEIFKVELVDAIPADQELKIYKPGRLVRPLPRPAHDLDRQDRQRLQADEGRGRLLARRFQQRQMLPRIYGTAFAKQEELDAYLKQLEEAEKRDHRKLGREMDLFHFQEEAPGSVFWHPKGWTLFQTLEQLHPPPPGRGRLCRGELAAAHGQGAVGHASGHMRDLQRHDVPHREREEDERVYAIKPMNCPGHVQIFKNGLKSYRDLPLKIAEFGKVHRFEPSGALHGLMRVRAFTQDDAHIFITEEQIAEESAQDQRPDPVDLRGFRLRRRAHQVLRPAGEAHRRRRGLGQGRGRADAGARSVAAGHGRSNKGEGAFYGPKLEYVLRDAIGRDWQCGTVQVDLNLPGRLGAFYIDEHSNKVTPVMLHRAMFGSLERFIGILIEHYAGHLPLWLVAGAGGGRHHHRRTPTTMRAR